MSVLLNQKFQPGPGRIAVVVDHETALTQRAKRAGIVVAEETAEFQQQRSPWAMVVGVGEPEVTQYGTTINTDVKEGDFVAFSRVGLTLWLDDGEEGDYIYVLPFAGVLGRLSWSCEKCAFFSRSRPETAPNCPNCPDIVAPTLSDQNLVKLTRQ
jgi:co-chaperonin GroES (HSP10)